MFKKLLESIRDFWHNHELYTPVSEMTKADIENIINRIKEKEELISKSNNCNNDYLEIKKQQKEKAQLLAAEQTQILKLLNDKIEALNLKAIEPTNNLEKLQQYLTEYSFSLKKHFYG